MSRTIRRKNLKYPSYWSGYTRAEFDAHKEDYLSNEWRKPREYYHWGLKQYVVSLRGWYHNEVIQHNTYDDMIAHRDARFHSDAGFPVHSHQIGASWRRDIERSHRAKRKAELICAMKRGEEEELMVTPFTRDVSWYY